MKVYYGSAYLPHIDYTVCFRPYKAPPDTIKNAKAWIRRDDRCGCTIYLPKDQTPSGLSHELIHALQYICIDRCMDFDREFEHMAYLMQYLMGKVFGFDWVKEIKRNHGKRKARAPRKKLRRTKSRRASRRTR
jgi:hypothetical protein